MKVCFIYDPEPNARYLEILSKMTPGRSGVWKDMVGVSNPKEADWCVVIDSTVQEVPEKTLYVSAHPKMENYHNYVDLSNKKYKLDNAETFGFGEWWLKYDYDTLSKMECPKKEKELVCIMSNSTGPWGRTERVNFAKMLHARGMPLYGRIKGAGAGELGTYTPTTYWFGKADVYEKYKYALEIDVGDCRNYFSERFFDALLMWCMPLYWGCSNVHEYIPQEAFRYIDIFGNGDDVLRYQNSGEWEKSLGAIAEARDLLLNKYQLWARVYDWLKQHS